MRPKSHFKYLTSDNLKSAMILSNAHYFCHGYSDIDLFKKNGCNVNNFYPIGSFVGGIYWNDITQNIKPKYDICLVSSWVSNNTSNLDKNALNLWKIDKAANHILEENLRKLLNEKKYKIVIALKHDNSEEEFNHFYNIFGTSVSYQKSERDRFSTYKAIDKSHLAISTYSTCVAEAIGVGRKGLFVNCSGNSDIGIQAAGICYHEGSDYARFSYKIDSMLNMSDIDFKNIAFKDLKNLMNYDLLNMPHKKIQKFLQTHFRKDDIS